MRLAGLDHYRHDSDADVAMLLRGEHRRLLPTKLAMADEAVRDYLNICSFQV